MTNLTLWGYGLQSPLKSQDLMGWRMWGIEGETSHARYLLNLKLHSLVLPQWNNLTPFFEKYCLKFGKQDTYKETTWKGKCRSTQKIRKERGKSYPKNEEISGQKAHTKLEGLIERFQRSQMCFLIRRE